MDRPPERAAWSARGELDVVIVRPPLVYGPRDVDVLQMIRSSNWRIVARPGFRNYWMSAIHVQDLVRGIVLAADRGRPLPQHSTNHVLDPSAETGSTALSGQGIYFLDDGDRHTIASFGQDAATALGKRALTVPIPWPIAWLAGLGSELVGRLRGVCPAYNLDKARASFSSGWWCSAGQAQLELGYEAQVPLSEGLPRTIHWYKENGLL